MKKVLIVLAILALGYYLYKKKKSTSSILTNYISPNGVSYVADHVDPDDGSRFYQDEYGERFYANA